MKYIKIFVLIITVVTAKHYQKHDHLYLAKLLNTKENLFSKTNEKIHYIMNQMFDSMKLFKRFPEKPRIKMLLAMHYDLKKIVEKNFEVHDVLKNVTEVDNKTINNIQLDELITEILSDKRYNANNNITEEVNEQLQTVRPTVNPPSDNMTSKEFREIMGAFLNKISGLTVDDLFKSNDSVKQYELTRRNLKAWKPWATSLEIDTFDDIQTRRIYSGKSTKIYKFPFIVSIHILREFTCSGSIISKDLILTAASCMQIYYNNIFFKEKQKTTYVRLGSDWTSKFGKIIPVVAIYFCPQYNPRTLHHNLAILRLERAIHFEEGHKVKIRRIQIDRGERIVAAADNITILGWGAKSPNQIETNFNKLSFASLDIYPIDECKEIYSEAYVTINHFCAGYKTKGGGACNRDVGGPGIVDDVLVGVVSFGSPVCGAKDAPTVFTRVKHYVDWIQTILNLDSPRTTTRKPSSHRIEPVFPEAHAWPRVRLSSYRQHSEETELQVLSDIIRANDTIVNDIINNDLLLDFDVVLM